MKAAGEPANLYVDSVQRIAEGDYIQTPTGRTYLVHVVRVAERGRHAGVRQYLQTTVMPADHVIDEDSMVIPIAWYSRSRKVRR